MSCSKLTRALHAYRCIAPILGGSSLGTFRIRDRLTFSLRLPRFLNASVRSG